MITPFYLDTGYSKTEIGVALKLFGFWAVLFGGFLGGLLVLRLGLHRALRFFSLMQAGALLGFMLIASLPKNLWHLYTVVVIDDLSSAMGTAALSGFIAIHTQKEYSAGQFALLSGLAVLPKNLFLAVLQASSRNTLAMPFSFYCAPCSPCQPSCLLLKSHPMGKTKTLSLLFCFLFSQWLLLAHPYQHALATDNHCKVCAIAGQPMAAPACSAISLLILPFTFTVFFLSPLYPPFFSRFFFSRAPPRFHML